MGRDTPIAWTDCTANTAFGCRMVDRACGLGEDLSLRGCYMFRMRKAWGERGEDIRLFDLEHLRGRLLSWVRQGKRLCFLNDMTDTFGEFFTDAQILEWHKFLIEKIQLEFQLLTKRIGRAMVFYRRYYDGKPPDNVWLGCSVGERSRLRRLDQLREVDAKVRFVSFEPLIESLGDFDLRGIHWAIIGGESGADPRPMKPEWAEGIVDICRRDGVKVFFKQMGGHGSDGAGGDLLNGRKIHEWPLPNIY